MMSTRKAQRIESSASFAAHSWGPFSSYQQGSKICCVVRSHLFPKLKLQPGLRTPRNASDVRQEKTAPTLSLSPLSDHCLQAGLDQYRKNQPGRDWDAILTNTGRVVNLSATSLELITRSSGRVSSSGRKPGLWQARHSSLKFHLPKVRRS